MFELDSLRPRAGSGKKQRARAAAGRRFGWSGERSFAAVIGEAGGLLGEGEQREAGAGGSAGSGAESGGKQGFRLGAGKNRGSALGPRRNGDLALGAGENGGSALGSGGKRREWAGGWAELWLERGSAFWHGNGRKGFCQVGEQREAGAGGKSWFRH